MPDTPWIERVLGPSWQTSLVGLGGVPIALVVSWVGIAWDSKELLGFGLTIFGLAVAALGVLARSHQASVAAHDQDRRRIAADIRETAEDVARTTVARELQR
jgi:hypothetical protein